MPRQFRLDFGTLGQAERTAQGGLKIPADLTRTGVFVYHTDDGRTIREYRPPEEVFHADTLATLKGSTLTVDHPPEKISPSNFRQFSTGHVGDDVRREENRTAATLYVQDQAAIKAIEAGRREISCGYHCDVDEKPGTSPEGESYDRIQRGIRYNHTALVPTGRAGHDVRLRLDSAGDSIGETLREDTMADENKTLKVEIIEGIEYPVGSEPHRAARERADAASKLITDQLKEAKQARADAEKALATEKGRADAATSKLNKVVEGIKVELSTERIDAAVRNRAEIVTVAQAKIGKEFKADGKSNREIKLEVLRKLYPDLEPIRQDSADAPIDSAYIKGLWASVKSVETPAKKPGGERNDAADALRRSLTPIPGQDGNDKPATAHQVRLDYYDEQEQRAHRPLALSRSTRGRALQSAQLETQR